MTNSERTPIAASAGSSISEDVAQISIRSRQSRRLTVSYGRRSVHEPDGRSTPVPLLRLQGAWLKHAGFPVGVSVTVHVSAGRLIIEPSAPELVPRAEVLARIARVAEDGLSKREFDVITRLLRRRGPAG
jgi:hypothetical protein